MHSILNCGASNIIIAISKSIDDKHKTEDLILIKWLKNEFSGPGAGKKWSGVHDKCLAALGLKAVDKRILQMQIRRRQGWGLKVFKLYRHVQTY